MAGKNHYRPLKVFADKTAKFKQINLIAQLYINSLDGGGVQIGEDDYNTIDKGVCLALVTMWLRQKLAGGHTFDRGSGQTEAQQIGNLRFVKRAVPQQILYKSAIGPDGMTQGEAREMMLDANGLMIDPAWTEKVFPGKTLVYQMIERTGGFPAAFHLRLDYGSGGSGHAVALYQNRTSLGVQAVFFDPNVGEYAIRPAFRDAFFQEYHRLAGLQFRTSITKVTSNRIRLKP